MRLTLRVTVASLLVASPSVVAQVYLEWGDRRLDMTGRVAWREGDDLGIDLERPSRELRSELGQMLEAMLRSPI